LRGATIEVTTMEDDSAEERENEFSDFFVGGIPPFLRFQIEYNSLFYLVENHKADRWYPDANPATQAALISLVANFEAFCKHQFGAMVNIYPELLRTFSTRRAQATIKLTDLVSLFGHFEDKVGFVVAEQYDFGSATLINGLFRDLLDVTPFSKDEGEEFDKLLMKRHLLVHHAGYYTLKFLKENSLPHMIKREAFQRAIKIGTEDYHRIGDFLFEMSMKVARVTVKALERLFQANGRPHHTEAVRELLRGLNDYLE
jgi:hypothetical protein